MPIQHQRRRAVLALVTVMAALIALVVPLVAMALAQQAPSIKFLNPSGYKPCPDPDVSTCFVLSDARTGTDEADKPNEDSYRLNAWTANTPANALVEFELDLTTELGVVQTITIGTADQVAPDTFEYNWEIPGSIPDGQYVLRAILYGGGVGIPEEVARHELTAFILAGNPTADTRKPAADMIYPTNGGQAGFYVNPITGRTNILVDVEWSQGTTFFTVNYTLSDPGDEPVWKTCAGPTRVGFSNNAPAGQTRVRCILNSADQGGQSVTGFSVVSNDSPATNASSRFDPNLNEAGDAVRVFPYLQDATSITIAPATTRVDPHPEDGFDDTCSEAQRVQVLDQQTRPIAEIGVDAHAVGPSDQTKFSAGGFFGGPPASNQAPDRAHGTESGFVCGELEGLGQNFAGDQGEHNRAGAPDQKHIETNSSGSAPHTDNNGTWAVSLHTDRAGETQLTFWVDEDDDDLYCSAEIAVAGSIGWGQPAPVPTLEQPTKTDCPVPIPPPPTETGTETGSPSPTPTGPDRGCTIEGDDGDNVLEGTEGNDVICGHGGDDTIRGFGGDDILRGDEGDDEIFGGDGDDTIDGGENNDLIFGDAGDDVVNAGNGADIIHGGIGNDTLAGGTGTDGIRGQGGRDILQGGRDNDALVGGGGDDLIRGHSGDDFIRGGKGADTLRGGADDDRIQGNKGPDSISGGPGRDRCSGGPGRDRTRGCEPKQRR